VVASGMPDPELPPVLAPIHVTADELSGRLLAGCSLPASCPFESVGHAMIAGVAAGIRRSMGLAPTVEDVVALPRVTLTPERERLLAHADRQVDAALQGRYR